MLICQSGQRSAATVQVLRAAGYTDVHSVAGGTTVTIDLKSGTERATVWTNDLTHAYVHENSAYSS